MKNQMKIIIIITMGVGILLGTIITIPRAWSANPSGASQDLSLKNRVTYRVDFKSTWSRDTHPTQFPGNPHFSDLVGAVHNNRGRIWHLGSFASLGMEQMAETGGKGLLLSEVSQHIRNGGFVFNSFSAPGLIASPGTTTFTLTVTPRYPQVTLVSMLAPSPDWFVGVSGLNLFESGTQDWVSRKVVDLRVYDAGTDGGGTFTSPDLDESYSPITRLNSNPYESDFRNGNPPVGQLIFERMDDGDDCRRCRADDGDDSDHSKPSPMRFVPVSAGSFSMGSPETEVGRDNDEARHHVTISKPFEIGATEVTQWQWFEVMGTNPSYFRQKRYCPESYMERDGVSMCANLPVEQVSWSDIQGYIKKYNQRARANHGSNNSYDENYEYRYRLPTEAEWEFAARGGAQFSTGTKTAYSFGDNPLNLKNYGWYAENSGSGKQGQQSRPVGLLSPNPLGLYDVHGNVWEWVGGWYEKYPEGPVTDPRGPRNGSYRIVRGGGWGNSARSLRSSYRSYDRPADRWGNIGFRLVRTPM